MRKLIALLVIFQLSTIVFANADKVLVEKSRSRLTLLENGNIIKQYTVAFGANPNGHKQQEGDERTPEGIYILDYKNANSLFYKSIHISYPNEIDRKRAMERGVDPGGDIVIHGQRDGLDWPASVKQLFNWTDGCIAVTNPEMDEIWSLVDVGTLIEIRP